MGNGDLTNYFIVLVCFLSVIGAITVYKHSKTLLKQLMVKSNSLIEQLTVKVKLFIHHFKKIKYQNQIADIDKKLTALRKTIANNEKSFEQLQPYEFLLKRFAAVDVETTGLKAAKSNIIQISIVLFIEGEPKYMYSQYVNPGVPLPPSATKVNNITNEMVKDAPRFDQLAEFVSRIVTREKIVAHNLRFDAAFIERELSKTPYKNEIYWGFCTMSLEFERPSDLNNKPGRFIKLSELARKMDVEVKGSLHDAYTDALVAGKIAVKIAKEHYQFQQDLMKENESKECECRVLEGQKRSLEHKLVPNF